MFTAAAFLVFSLATVVLAFVRHPIHGLFFYLACYYVFPPSRWWGYLFGDMRWALLSAAIAALAIALHRGMLRPKPLWLSSPPVVLLLLYALWMWIQTPWALAPADHLYGAEKFTKCLLAYWIVYRVVDSKERVRDLLLAHTLGCALLGLYAFHQGRQGGRLDGVGGPGIDDANTLGMYFATGAMTALGIMLTQRGPRRWVALGCGAFILNGLVLTNTRGALLGLVAGGLVFMVCKARQHRRWFWGLVAAGALVLPALVDPAFVARMLTLREVAAQDEEIDTSAQSRVELAKAQWQMFLRHPLGAGHRGTVELSTTMLEAEWQAVQGGRASHNTFLTALVEQGAPGAVLYLGLLAWFVGTLLKVRRRARLGHGDPELTTLGAALVGALAVVLVSGNTADFLMAEVQFWLYAGLVTVLWLERAAPAGPESKARPVQPPLSRAAA